jgi:hypothetical protein
MVRGNFVGAILEHVTLPVPQHGTVALVKGHGPVLLYQIGEHETRILIDVKNPLPSDLKVSNCPFCSPSEHARAGVARYLNKLLPV